MNDQQKPKSEEIDEDIAPLVEPYPVARPGKGNMRVQVDDGFDNSDLRTLIALATKKANEEE